MSSASLISPTRGRRVEGRVSRRAFSGICGPQISGIASRLACRGRTLFVCRSVAALVEDDGGMGSGASGRCWPSIMAVDHVAKARNGPIGKFSFSASASAAAGA